MIVSFNDRFNLFNSIRVYWQDCFSSIHINNHFFSTSGRVPKKAKGDLKESPELYLRHLQINFLLFEDAIITMYRAEVIMRMASPPDICNRLLINGGFNLEKRFDPKVDDLWQKITHPTSKDQVIDVDCKILRKNGKTVVEGSVQYRDRRYENGVQIRCDNYHAPNLFHMDKLTGTNVPDRSKWKREWKKPVTEPLPKSSTEKFRLALHKVLLYVEENYDLLIAPKFFFPYFGTEVFKALKRLKPKNLSLSQYSELIGIITALQMEEKHFESLELKDWIKEIVAPATVQIKKAIQEGKVIKLMHKGVLTMPPIPLFAPPGSQVTWMVWSPKQQILNLKPVGIVFQRKV